VKSVALLVLLVACKADAPSAADNAPCTTVAQREALVRSLLADPGAGGHDYAAFLHDQIAEASEAVVNASSGAECTKAIAKLENLISRTTRP
jgi:hypothetical protein